PRGRQAAMELTARQMLIEDHVLPPRFLLQRCRRLARILCRTKVQGRAGRLDSLADQALGCCLARGVGLDFVEAVSDSYSSLEASPSKTRAVRHRKKSLRAAPPPEPIRALHFAS